MTDLTHSDRTVTGARARRTECLVRQLAATLKVVRPEDMADVTDLLSGWLEGASAGMPDAVHPFGNLREDAGFWADIATPAELEAYVAAGLRRIERRQFAQVALKRIFVTIWECMSDADRRRFLGRVDPAGKFRKAG